jgi:hypothetical protein
MRQLPAGSECCHEKHDAPKILRLDHLHRVITTNGNSCAARGSRSFDHLPASTNGQLPCSASDRSDEIIENG